MDNNTNILKVKQTNFQKPMPYIITICSGKGGVGKSVMAANIASSITNDDLSVLLWDADRQFPNLHLILGVDPPVRLNEVYEGHLRINKAIFALNENFSLLADEAADGEQKNISSAAIFEVYRQIIQISDHDVIIIDAQAGVTEDVIQCCKISDLIICIVNDEPTSLLDAYALIKILTQILETDKISILINNVIDTDDASEIYEKLNLATDKFLHRRFDTLGYVPYDRAVRRSIQRQELFVDVYPDSDVTLSVRKIASILSNRIKNNEFEIV